MQNDSGSYYYQDRLRDELTKRVEKNPRYSLRSFATAIGIEPSTLSLILSGKRPISTKMIEKIFQSLEFSTDEKKKFLESVLAEKKVKGLSRVSSTIQAMLSQLSSHPSGNPPQGVGLYEFRIISDWYHYAILELTFSPSFEPTPKWIARTIGITEIEAKLAIDRLLKLELLERHGRTLRKTNFKLETKDQSKTSVFHKKRQKQLLEKSMHSLEQDPIDQRNHTSLTFCINPARLADAKEQIQKFMWNMNSLLSDADRTQVYNLQVSLFPLQTRTRNSNENK